MIDKVLNDKIVNAIKQKLPEDSKLISFIMNTIHLGKEASYRRLRGDVPFSMKEVACIAQKLNISLDDLLVAKDNGKAMFDVRFLGNKNVHDEYSKILNKYIEILSPSSINGNAVIHSASNLIPSEFIFKHKNLTKLRLFKWIYQRNLPLPVSLSETYIPDYVYDKHRLITDLMKEMKIIYILESELFLKTIMDIKYFIKLNAFTPQDVLDLKKELLSIIEELEMITNTGVNSKGKEVLVYLSHVFFETPHLYIEWDDIAISAIRLYSVNTLFTQDALVCNEEKWWLQGMKKYSTLISQCGESDRIHFFNEQKERIETIIV